MGIKSETHLSYWLLTTRPGSKTQNISSNLAVHGTRHFILWHILLAAIWFRLARMYVQLSSDIPRKEDCRDDLVTTSSSPYLSRTAEQSISRWPRFKFGCAARAPMTDGSGDDDDGAADDDGGADGGTDDGAEDEADGDDVGADGEDGAVDDADDAAVDDANDDG